MGKDVQLTDVCRPPFVREPPEFIPILTLRPQSDYVVCYLKIIPNPATARNHLQTCRLQLLGL